MVLKRKGMQKINHKDKSNYYDFLLYSVKCKINRLVFFFIILSITEPFNLCYWCCMKWTNVYGIYEVFTALSYNI